MLIRKIFLLCVYMCVYMCICAYVCSCMCEFVVCVCASLVRMYACECSRLGTRSQYTEAASHISVVIKACIQKHLRGERVSSHMLGHRSSLWQNLGRSLKQPVTEKKNPNEYCHSIHLHSAGSQPGSDVTHSRQIHTPQLTELGWSPTGFPRGLSPR